MSTITPSLIMTRCCQAGRLVLTRWRDGTRYIPKWHCVSCGRLAGEDTVRSAVRWLYWTPPSDGGWTFSLKICASCQGDRWRSMCRSLGKTCGDVPPGVKTWSERLLGFIARRMIQDGVDEDDVSCTAFSIGQAVNTLWIDPEDDDDVPLDVAIAHNRWLAGAGSSC